MVRYRHLVTASLCVVLAGSGAGAQEQVEPEVGGACDSLCITPSRTVSFETSQGSQMNLDVSPDGETILFDLLGDLYTVRRNGGPATQLTSGPALDLQPVFSPDGSRHLVCERPERKRKPLDDRSGRFETDPGHHRTW